MINPLLTCLCGQDGWILAMFFFTFLLNLTSSQSIKRRTRMWPISSHLDFMLGQILQGIYHIDHDK